MADTLKENFAFTIHFLQNWCADDVKNSETPYVKLLTEQNFDFFVKKEYFFIFYIFWSLEFFSGKIMLADLWPAVGRPTHEKIIEKCWPAKCPKNFFGKKNKNFKKFSRILIFSTETFFSKNFRQFSIFEQFISSPMCI